MWALYLSGVPRWQLINNAGPALWGHSAIYDPVGDRMIVAFGSPYASPVATNDVWELALSGSTRWTSLSPLLASARFGASLVHDPVRRRMLVFGGVGASDSNPWAMDLTGDAGWIPLTPTGDQPHKRWYSGCAYSPFYDEVFMFGGANGTTVLGDTWSLVFGSRPAPPPPPSLRSFSPAVGSAGEIVTLEGEHFIGVRAVHFMGVPAPILDTAEARIITRVPLGATTGRIVVFGVHGQTTSLTEFTVTPAVPRIDSIVPAAAKIGAWVRIHGANFFPGISVYSGTGSMVENVVRLSDSLLAARTDSATAGYLIACFPGLCSNTLAFQSIPLDGRALSVSVRDVPDDEGGRVLVEWMPGDLDNRDRAILTTYRVWRRSPESPAGSVRASREDCRLQESPAELEAAGWERLGDVPARQAERYSFVAETLQDSVAGSNPETAFFVQSLTHAPMSSFSSAISEGHSVDNRAPATPAAFDLSYSSQGVTLRWTASSSPDLLEYRVYRGVTRDFEPSSRNLEVVATDTTCVVGFGSFFYKLEAVDVHGNRGAAQVASSEPPGLSLDRIHPNPSLARAAVMDCVLGLEVTAALDVYDVTGRLALHRGLGSLGPGRHRLAIDSEGRLAPGVYLARLRQGREMRTVRFVVLGSR